MKFIDLFAGLGGFHLALQRLGHECVFASEVDPVLRSLYRQNFCLEPKGDIRQIDLHSIPKHQILCAGFPCQPFSKAGGQQGMECGTWGDLIYYIVNILKIHKPKFFIIENVPNIVRHNQGETWNAIRAMLNQVGYDVETHIFSPHQFGIPQVRKRAFIVGSTQGLAGFSWPVPPKQTTISINSILDKRPAEAKSLSSQQVKYINIWQEFLDNFSSKDDFPSFPVWAMEFGATYPFKEKNPVALSSVELGKSRGCFGIKLKGLKKSRMLELLPSYARNSTRKFPSWKVDIISKNRKLYRKNKEFIDQWKSEVSQFNPSFQKFEWNCKGCKLVIRKNLVQFRSSGIRVKRPTYAPSLVAITSQVPVIPWERRFMTPKECSRLQSMSELANLPADLDIAYKAFGNAVNVDVVEEIATELLSVSNRKKRHSHVTIHDKELEYT